MVLDPNALPPADDATEFAETAATEATEFAETAAGAPATESDWREIVKAHLHELDPDELLEQHTGLRDKLAGKAGRLAQEQAARLAQQERARLEAQLRYEADQQRLMAAAREEAEYSPFAKTWLGQQQTAEQTRAQLQAAQQFNQNHDAALLHHRLQKLPEADQQEILQKIQTGGYGADWYQSRNAFLDDVTDRLVRAETSRVVGETKAQYEKRLAAVSAAQEREALGTAADESVDTGGSAGGGGGGALSPEAYINASEAQRAKWKRENPAAVNAMWSRMTNGR